MIPISILLTWYGSIQYLKWTGRATSVLNCATTTLYAFPVVFILLVTMGFILLYFMNKIKLSKRTQIVEKDLKARKTKPVTHKNQNEESSK